MIDFDIVKNLIIQLALKSDLKIARGNQLVKKPSYPYAVYNIIGINEEPLVSNILEQGGTGPNVTITRNQYSEDTVSFTVISKKYEEARKKTQDLFNSFKSEEIHDFLSANKCSAILGLTNIQDRTVFLEADYEYKFGFDIVLKSQTAYTETVENVVEIQATQELYDEGEVLHTQEIIVTR